MLQCAIIGAAIGLLFSLVILWRAKNAKGGKYLTEMTKRVLTFAAPQAPAEVVAALEGGASGHPATLEAADKTAHRLVLTDKASLASFGFFYPIHVAAAPGGGSSVSVGIASRGNQWGPLVTKAHNIFADAVKKTLGVAAG